MMEKTCLLPPKTCLLHRRMMLAMIVMIMREKNPRTWIEPLWVQAGSTRRSAEHLCHARMVGQGGEDQEEEKERALINLKR